jgi:hypothetical protein
MSPPAASLSHAEVTRAVPSWARRISSQREALRRGLACPDLADVRSDFREHLTAWWRIHVNHASWGGEGRPPRGTTEPTRARVCELAGMSVSTYKACRRWWADRGYIAIVRPGWTPGLRPAVLASPGDHNVRQAYVLCLPRKNGPAPRRSSARTLTRPLSQSRRDLDRFPAREERTGETGKPDKTACAQRSPVLRRGALAGLTDGWWAHITAPFAAWTAAELVRAIDHLPSGRQHRTSIANIRHPAGWLRWRLSHWLGPDGTPLPSPGQQRTDAARRHRAYLAARRAEHAQRKAARLPDHLQLAAAAEARRRLAERGTAAVAAAAAACHLGPADVPAGARLARALLAARDDENVRDAILNAWAAGCQDLGGDELLRVFSAGSRSGSGSTGHSRMLRETAPDLYEQVRCRYREVWQVLGSNQRRLSRRFYRPLPLATRATCRRRPRGRHREE